MSYREIAEQIGEIVEIKNSSYGDAFNKAGEILKILYPQGIQTKEYTDVLAMIRIIDKLFRIANNKKAFNEDPWMDIAGYAILGVEKERKMNK